MKVKTPRLMAAVSLVAFSAVLCAQESLDPTGLLLRASAALGVSPGGVTSVVASGTYVQFGVEGTQEAYPFRLKIAGADKARWEMDLLEGTQTRVIDGGGGWVGSFRGQAPLPLSLVSGGTAEFLPVLALANWLASANVKMGSVTQEEIDGVSLLRIPIRRGYEGAAPDDFKKAFEQVTRCELYLDPINFVPVRLRYYEHPGDWRRDVPVDLVYSNYQSVSGATMPMTVSRFLGGRKASEIQFKTISLNAAIADSEFAKR